MNIAIFGSCVSRDTCEYIPNAKVVEYVARQSVTSLLKPRNRSEFDLESIESPFQRRMVEGDLQGNGSRTIQAHSSELDAVLVDLVDERRGFFLFDDGSTMTNSVEVETNGLTESTEIINARHVPFGSDEHFRLWSKGFHRLSEDLEQTGLLKKTILLDIEWAQAIEGSRHPHQSWWSHISRQYRRAQRGLRKSIRGYTRDQSAYQAWMNFKNVESTEAELFAERAKRANSAYIRYRQRAGEMIPSRIQRESPELRIAKNHKWGPQPFHYRPKDYQSIAQSIVRIVEGNSDA